MKNYCTGFQMCVCQRGSQCNCAQIIKQDRHQHMQLFSQTMEKQLNALSTLKEDEIDQLHSTIQQLKLKNLKLQHRHQLDQQHQNKLKQTMRELEEKVLELRKNQHPEPTIRQIIKEKIVQKQISNPNLQNEIQQLRSTNKQLREKLASKEEMLLALEEELQLDRNKSKHRIQKLQSQNQTLHQLLKNKEQQIEALKTSTIFLQERVQILSKRPTQYSPLIIEKLQPCPQPKIQTIYVEKPVEKVVYVEVQKKIKEFIQPEKPVVNRIINCPEKKECRCEDEVREPIQIDDYEHTYAQYDNVIASYKNERQKLVSVIKDRNSDIRLLERQLSLFSGRPKNTESDVQVKVTRDVDHRPVKKEEAKTVTRVGKKK